MVTVVSSGQVQFVDAGASINGSVLRGGSQVVLSQGSAVATVISSGGLQIVHSGGHVVSTSIKSGGTQIIQSHAFAEDTSISNGGVQWLSSGGYSSGTTIASSGKQIVGFQAWASQTTVSRGGTEQLMSLSNADGTTVLAGGFLIEGANSLATNSRIRSGGTVVLYGNATFGGTIVAGATVSMTSGDFSEPPVVDEGENFIVGAKALVNTVAVRTGATLHIVSGGIAGAYMSKDATVLDSGGIAAGVAIAGDKVVVNGGGTLDMTLSSGATATVASGSKVGVDLDGGTLIVASGVVSKGETINLSAGTARLSGTDISFTTGPFGTAKLDLASFQFGQGETLSYSGPNIHTYDGTLTIKDGNDVATITLFALFAHYVAAGFHIASDNAGGSILTYSAPSTAGTHADIVAPSR